MAFVRVDERSKPSNVGVNVPFHLAHVDVHVHNQSRSERNGVFCASI